MALILVRARFPSACMLEGSRVAGWPVLPPTCSHSAPHSHPRGFYVLLLVVLAVSPLDVSLCNGKENIFCPTGAGGSKEQPLWDCRLPLPVSRSSKGLLAPA